MMKRRVSSQPDIKQPEVRTLIITPKACISRDKTKRDSSRKAPVFKPIFQRYSSRPRDSSGLSSAIQCKRVFDVKVDPSDPITSFRIKPESTRSRPSSAKHPQPVRSIQLKKEHSLVNTQNSLENYLLESEIGRGAYAVVKSAINRQTKKRVAIKIYEKSNLSNPKRKKSVEREIRILSKLDHPNIVKLFEVVDTEFQVALVLEYVQGSSLRSILKRKPQQKLSEYEARGIFRALISGIEYCHSKCVTHRDIKLDNILIDQNNKLKIIDFGFATCLPPETKLKMFCGTPSYMAPEIVDRKEFNGGPADIWACGVVLYSILTGNFPFKGVSDKDLFTKIHRGNFIVPEFIPLSPRLLIRNMLEYQPTLRPTAKDVAMDSWINPTSNTFFSKAITFKMTNKRRKSVHDTRSIDIPFLTTDID